MDDNRRLPRINFSQPIQWSQGSSVETSGSLSKDISAGGMRIRLAQFIPLQSRVELNIELEGKIIECAGEVAWINKLPLTDSYEAGIRFIQDQNFMYAQKRISRFVHRDKNI